VDQQPAVPPGRDVLLDHQGKAGTTYRMIVVRKNLLVLCAGDLSRGG
jgi:hypothetical protein